MSAILVSASYGLTSKRTSDLAMTTFLGLSFFAFASSAFFLRASAAALSSSSSLPKRSSSPKRSSASSFFYGAAFLAGACDSTCAQDCWTGSLNMPTSDYQA
jgi:hypothetical protein